MRVCVYIYRQSNKVCAAAAAGPHGSMAQTDIAALYACSDADAIQISFAQEYKTGDKEIIAYMLLLPRETGDQLILK